MPARSYLQDWMLPSFKADLRTYIADELKEPGDVLVSSEGLSYLRHDDEVQALLELLEPRAVEFVVVLRDPKDFLRSYRAELAKQGFPPSTYEESFAFTDDSTWLTDYRALLKTFNDPKVISYEDAIGRYGSVIPALMETCVRPVSRLPSWEGLWANKTQPRPPQPFRGAHRPWASQR
jgi:hypothetical protein